MWWRWRWQKKKKKGEQKEDWAKVAELWWWGWLFRQKKRSAGWSEPVCTAWFLRGLTSQHTERHLLFIPTQQRQKVFGNFDTSIKEGLGNQVAREVTVTKCLTGLIGWETPVCSGGKPAVGIDVYSCQICIHYMGVMDTLERNNTVKAEVEVRLCNPLKAFHSVFSSCSWGATSVLGFQIFDVQIFWC